MNYKRIIVAVLLISSYGAITGQSLISSNQHSFMVSGFELTGSVGEPIIGIGQTGNFTFTQGFQQPVYGQLTSIEQFDANKTTLQVYPNPVIAVLNIKLSSKMEITSIALHNTLGQKLDEVNIISDITTLNMSAYQEGIYLLKIRYNNSYNHVTKIKNNKYDELLQNFNDCNCKHCNFKRSTIAVRFRYLLPGSIT